MTFENVQYLKVKYGWKPGAISKHLLKILNKAKLRKPIITEIKQVKRQRKLTRTKPLIKVCKTNGRYHVEMQVSDDKHTPLIYNIESANNKAKLRKRGKLQRYLISDALRKVGSDPFHPQNCENICLRALYEAIGKTMPKEVVSESIQGDDCSCDDEEVSTSCDSSEADWEIHFTPPIANYLRSQLYTVEEPL